MTGLKSCFLSFCVCVCVCVCVYVCVLNSFNAYRPISDSAHFIHFLHRSVPLLCSSSLKSISSLNLFLPVSLSLGLRRPHFNCLHIVLCHFLPLASRFFHLFAHCLSLSLSPPSLSLPLSLSLSPQAKARC